MSGKLHTVVADLNEHCFLEAMILNMIDDIDAKIFEFSEAVKDVDPGSFSAKNFALGNIQVYKTNI